VQGNGASLARAGNPADECADVQIDDLNHEAVRNEEPTGHGFDGQVVPVARACDDSGLLDKERLTKQFVGAGI
jgi:hypothetical protein